MGEMILSCFPCGGGGGGEGGVGQFELKRRLTDHNSGRSRISQIGAPTSKVGAKTYYLVKSFPKTA